MAYSQTPEQANLLALLQEAMRRTYAADDGDLNSVRDWMMGQLQTPSDKEVKALLAWAESFDKYDAILAARAERSLLPPNRRREFAWPWATWRKKCDAPDEGMIALIAAAPATGKTIAAEQVAEYNAMAGLHGAFFHFELSPAVMWDRRAVRNCIELPSDPPRRILRRGLLTPEQLERLSEDLETQRNVPDGLQWSDLSRAARKALDEANKRMRSWPGAVDYMHTPGWSVDDIVNYTLGEYTRRKETDAPLNFIVVDYLEKIAPSQRQLRMFGHDKTAREGDTVEALKNLAESTGIVVVALAQLSKAGRNVSTDNLSGTEIKGAGDKSERTNFVAILSLDTDTVEEPRQVVTVTVTKNTMGLTGSWDMWRVASKFMFTEE